MLTCDELKDYKEDWKAYFSPYCDETKAFAFAPVIAVAAGIVVPIVVDYAKTKLKEESENYVQQFGTTYFGTSWENKDKKKYYGFEIVRNAKRYNDTGEKEEVFKIVYGFLKDDKDIFWAAPLYFKTNKTKAKVSSWGSSHKINTKVEIALDAVWIDGQAARARLKEKEAPPAGASVKQKYHHSRVGLHTCVCFPAGRRTI